MKIENKNPVGLSKEENIKEYEHVLLYAPLLSQPLAAGFPSPAADYTEENPLDLNAYLVKNKSASFYFTVEGESMIGAGIYPGDKVLVDRSVPPRSGHIIVAVLNGGFTIKRLFQNGPLYELRAENSQYPNIKIRANDEFTVWGVVTAVIRKIAH